MIFAMVGDDDGIGVVEQVYYLGEVVVCVSFYYLCVKDVLC
jgi:hypothetical protein